MVEVSLFPNAVSRKAERQVDIREFLTEYHSKEFSLPAWFFESTEGRPPLIPEEYKQPLERMLDGKTLLECQNEIRSYVDLNSKDQLVGYAKRCLPGITVSARFKGRRTRDAEYEHTGLIALDIDGINPDTVKSELKKLGIFYYIGESITGTGVFAIINIANPDKHLEHFASLQEKVNQVLSPLGGEVDYLPDITRLRYFSYDPTAVWGTDSPYTDVAEVSGVEDVADLDMLERLPPTNQYDRLEYADRCLAKAEVRRVYFDPEKGLNPYLIRVLPYFNMYGLSPGYTAKYLWEKLSVRSDFDTETYTFERVDYDVKHFYQVYHEQHHILQFPKREIKVPKFEIHAEYELEQGQKLSDIHLETKLKTLNILESETGTGKTWWAVHKLGKVDIISPTQDLVKQGASEYGINAVLQGTNPNADDVQIGTYNAVEKFVKRECRDRTLFVDEAHTLVTSASKSFRSDVVNMVVDSFVHYKRVILASGTWINTIHPLLRNFHRIKVKSPLPVKNWCIVRYENRTKSLRGRLVHGKLNVVFLNDKVAAKKVGTFLQDRGWKVQLFNADTKPSKSHKNIIEKQEVDQDVEVLFVTSVYVEGLNLYNRNIATLHVLSQIPGEILQQIANRTRKKLPDMTYIYIPEATDEEDWSFNFVNKQIELLEHANEVVENGDRHKEFGYHVNREVFAEKIISSMQFEVRNMIRLVDGEFEVDYLGLTFVALLEKRSAIFKNPKLLEMDLNRYGWERKPDETDLTMPTTTDTIHEKELHQMAVEAKIRDFEDALDRLKELTEEDAAYLYRRGVEDSSLGKALEAAIDITSYIPWEKALGVLEVSEGRTSRIKRIKQQLLVQAYLQTDRVAKSADTKTIDAVYNCLKIGETYTRDEMESKVRKVLRNNWKLRRVKLTRAKVTSILKTLFGMERTSKRVEGEKKPKLAYRITDRNPLDVDVSKPHQPKLKPLPKKIKQLKLF